jgi:hypothetical protein
MPTPGLESKDILGFKLLYLGLFNVLCPIVCKIHISQGKKISNPNFSAASKKDAHPKIGQNRLGNNHLATLI